MHHIGLGYSLQRIPRFAPGCQTAYDDKCIKSPSPQKMRHAGACRFLLASAVQVDILVSREQCYLGCEIVGLDSNRAGNADSARTVITMAPYIGQYYRSRAFCLQLRGQYL